MQLQSASKNVSPQESKFCSGETAILLTKSESVVDLTTALKNDSLKRSHRYLLRSIEYTNDINNLPTSPPQLTKSADNIKIVGVTSSISKRTKSNRTNKLNSGKRLTTIHKVVSFKDVSQPEISALRDKTNMENIVDKSPQDSQEKRQLWRSDKPIYITPVQIRQSELISIPFAGSNLNEENRLVDSINRPQRKRLPPRRYTHAFDSNLSTPCKSKLREVKENVVRISNSASNQTDKKILKVPKGSCNKRTKQTSKVVAQGNDEKMKTELIEAQKQNLLKRHSKSNDTIRHNTQNDAFANCEHKEKNDVLVSNVRSGTTEHKKVELSKGITQRTKQTHKAAVQKNDKKIKTNVQSDDGNTIMANTQIDISNDCVLNDLQTVLLSEGTASRDKNCKVVKKSSRNLRLPPKTCKKSESARESTKLQESSKNTIKCLVDGELRSLEIFSRLPTFVKSDHPGDVEYHYCLKNVRTHYGHNSNGYLKILPGVTMETQETLNHVVEFNVMSGRGCATVQDATCELEFGSSVHVPLGCKYNFQNTSSKDILLLYFNLHCVK